MTRFFFHVRNGSDLTLDEGLELSGFDNVQRDAWEGARGTVFSI